MRPTISTVAKMRLSKKMLVSVPNAGNKLLSIQSSTIALPNIFRVARSPIAACSSSFSSTKYLCTWHGRQNAHRLSDKKWHSRQNAAGPNAFHKIFSHGRQNAHRLFKQVARSPKCPQPHFLQTKLLGRVILLNNFGSFIEEEKDRLRCVRALSRVLVHLNVQVSPTLWTLGCFSTDLRKPNNTHF